jgi:hypothetical protein
LTTLPLQSWPKASPFWIMLLLSVGALKHQAAGNATDDQAPHLFSPALSEGKS